LAELAENIARVAGAIDPDECWCAGIAAALGWLAISIIDANGVARRLGHACNAASRIPGQECAAAARRLARAWGLPGPYAAVAGHLGLTAATAVQMGGHDRLQQIVQLAVALLKEHGDCLYLPCPHTVGELALALALDPHQVEQLESVARHIAASTPAQREWQAPAAMPLLRDVLTLAAENRRLRQSAVIGKLERHIDCLQNTVETQHATFGQRLEECKLSAMAEFAAGAGHEINNPLAVISGQAQYLIRSMEEDLPPERRRESLQKVIHQVQRIHDLLRQLMQFARPARSQRVEVDIVALVHEVITAHRDLAADGNVRLDAPAFGPALVVLVDPGQLRTVLNCLVKNALEAAGQSGWVAVRLERTAEDVISVLVEDNGPGPDRRQREHLFEPFFSGRDAGRGHGLGLPIAWRLAREQNSSVRFVPLPHGPTRFALTIPLLRPAEVHGFTHCNGRAHSS
jgi:signal transduction histidine kinase